MGFTTLGQQRLTISLKLIHNGLNKLLYQGPNQQGHQTLTKLGHQGL